MIAGGVESMTRAPYVMPKSAGAFGREQRLFDTVLGWRMVNPKMPEQWTISLGETAERVAELYNITREEQDRFALDSQRKCAAAVERAAFRDEIVPVTLRDARGNETEMSRDEHPRPDTTLEVLSRLRAAFKVGGTVTAGNSSGINDGAAALLLCEAEAARRRGLAPMARFVALRLGRRRARRHGARTDSGDAESAGARRDRHRRSRPNRNQRGVRGSGNRLHARARARSLDDECKRRSDRARSSARRERRANRDDASARAAPARRPLRAGDDVHRRRSRHRNGIRAR